MIILEGMGVNGSLLAWQLYKHAVPFRWFDKENDFTAWRASTGAIYPSGSTKFGPDAACHRMWSRWWGENVYSFHCERAGYWFCTKSEPHGGRHGVQGKLGPLQMSRAPSFHLNAQSLVEDTRAMFAGRRLTDPLEVVALSRPETGNTYIVTHGWGERLDHVYWGWTRLVELRFPLEFAQDGYRPSFYFRPNRVQMAYAYPVPGTQFWYAGSSIIKQKIGGMRSLEMQPKYDKWRPLFERLSGGQVEVVGEDRFIEGWRPAAAKDDTAWVRARGNVLKLRPLWNSGIRHFPYQWYQVATLLGIKDKLFEDFKA